MKTLVLGGVRSGKSRLAEKLALESGFAVSCIVTARIDGDTAMAERIRLHRERRPPSWRLIEEPVALANALHTAAAEHRCVLVDCLTLWLTNLLCDGDTTRLTREADALIATLPTLPGRVIFVANETGLGIVPLGELTRRYIDEAGVLHQRLAVLCERVVLTVAGLPLMLKGNSP